MKPWVKLHRGRSARFEALPVIARGLFDEMLAHVDDEGWIRLGTNSRTVLWRHIAAHPNERRALSRHLDTLVANGSVIESDEGWWMPSFEDYQDDRRRAPGAPPAGAQRASDASPACLRDASDVPPTRLRRASDASKIAPKYPKSRLVDPGDKIREEGDPDKTPPNPPEGGGALGDLEHLRREAERQLKFGYQRRFTGATKDEFRSWGAVRQHLRELAGWVVAKGPGQMQARVDALLDGAFADPWMREKLFPWGAIAKNPTKFAGVGVSGGFDEADFDRRWAAVERRRDEALGRGDHDGVAAAEAELDEMRHERRRALRRSA